ncbi:c55be238-e555-433e-a5b0-0cb6a58b9d60 [Thermothielavioides terrestris]|jgi:hypothetical protein
MVYT